ncbi:hypothetical protein D3C76_875140 [compost metagenome]
MLLFRSGPEFLFYQFPYIQNARGAAQDVDGTDKLVLLPIQQSVICRIGRKICRVGSLGGNLIEQLPNSLDVAGGRRQQSRHEPGVRCALRRNKSEVRRSGVETALRDTLRPNSDGFPQIGTSVGQVAFRTMVFGLKNIGGVSPCFESDIV